MVRHRPPQQLEDIAFKVWLATLDKVGLPQRVPPSLLTAALAAGSRLREVTLVRVAIAAVAAGVTKLEVVGVMLNPTLLEQLAIALVGRPNDLSLLSLELHPRHGPGLTTPLLAKALHKMNGLTHLRLTGGATDSLLRDIRAASPPLQYLDISYSPHVTDDGLAALLESQNGYLVSGEKLLPTKCENYKVHENVSDVLQPASTLQYLNIWSTAVTTKGCSLALQQCPCLEVLICQWTGEAVTFLHLKGSKSLPLKQLLLTEEVVEGSLLKLLPTMCPKLSKLAVRRPKDVVLNVSSVISSVPYIEDLSLTQFSLPFPQFLEFQMSMSHLISLHLSSLSAPVVDVASILNNCPCLMYLTLEAVIPTLRTTVISELTSNPLAQMKELRILTPIIAPPLDPQVVEWLVVRTKQLQLLVLGSCKLLVDQHILSMINSGALLKVTDVRLSEARHLTDEILELLTYACPDLRRLVLKMLPRERLIRLETIKVEFRLKNLDLELITYGHKF